MKLPILETSRLLLRPLTKEDLLTIYELFSDDVLMEPYGMQNLKNVDAANKLLTSMMEEGEWGIVHKEDAIVIGTLGFVAYKETHKRAEIAFEIKPSYWSKGYMKESLQAVVDYFFKETKMNRLEAYVYPRNKGSIKVLQKLGFKREAWLREYAFKRNKMEDYFVYAILRSDVETK